MDCPRCNGLMVVDHFIDMEDDSGQLWMRGWRCAICGEVMDPTIYKHRMIQSTMRDRMVKVTEPKPPRKIGDTIRLSA